MGDDSHPRLASLREQALRAIEEENDWSTLRAVWATDSLGEDPQCSQYDSVLGMSDRG
jgi:hypothetical protein